MFYELSLKVKHIDEQGNEKEKLEKYITDKLLFSEAEVIGMELYNNECDVIAVKRSKITEIINKKEDDKPFFKAVVCDVLTNDDGSEKEIDYHILVCAKDVKTATNIVIEYMKQGFSMELKSIAKTKILDVLE